MKKGVQSYIWFYDHDDISVFADVTMFPCFSLCPRQFYSQSGKYIGYLYVDKHVYDTI